MPSRAPSMTLYRESHPERPALDMAISHALLREVARTRAGAVRLYRPGATVAFGRLDKLRPGFADAVAAARRRGYAPVLRLSGGHAVAYDQRSLIFEEISAETDIVARLQDRFREGASTIAGALTAVGLQARLGELPGEYCAGSYSVNLGGRLKVAGSAQRLIRGAALFSAVILVGGGPTIREVLEGVYAALNLEWDPRTAGAVHDVAPSTRIEQLEESLIAGSRARHGLHERELDRALLGHAGRLEATHRP